MALTLEQKLDLLLERSITHTSFATIPLPAQVVPQGIAIGIGRCVAVILKLNSLVEGTETGTQTAVALTQIYYGDSNQQSFELIRGIDSNIIFCRDLSEVYIKGNGNANLVEILIYQSEPTDLEFYSA